MLKPFDPKQLHEIFQSFIDSASRVDIEKIKTGLINESYKVTCTLDNKQQYYLLQSVNTTVFQNPEFISHNIQVVYGHLIKSDYPRQILSIVPANTVTGLVINGGRTWRLLPFFPDTYNVEKVETTVQSYAAAFTFGEYLGYLSDLDPAKLKITIPDFHNPELRFKEFQQAVKNDLAGRLKEIQEIIEGFLEFKFLMEFDLSKQALRVTHNDLKISNVLFSKKDDTGFCVIDLDTLMPGFLILDFGDMVRSFTNEEEDFKDFHLVKMNMEIFEHLARGFFKGIGDRMSILERDALVDGTLLITYEQGLRFITDYLQGDPYYKIEYPDHNLIRAKNQLALLEDLFKKSDQMRLYLQKIV